MTTHTKKTQNTADNSESGIALLLTLGILSLVLILAMSFAFTARTDLESARVHRDITKARLLCDSGLERAMAYIAYNNLPDQDENGNLWTSGDERDGIFPARTGDLFSEFNGIIAHDSASSDSTNVDEEDLLVQFDGFTLFEPGTDPQWINVENSDNEVIGRYAYFVMDDSGKLDINHNNIDAGFSDNYDRSNPAFSWEHIVNDGSVSPNEDDVEYLTVSTLGEPRYEDTGMGRYDLYRLHDVDSEDLPADNDLNKSPDAVVDELMGDSSNDDGIFWLENWQEASTWDSAEDRAKQIAANIIDYFDDDVVDDDPDADEEYVPTVDERNRNKVNDPEYVGIEEVPMINDIRFQVTNTSTYNDPDNSVDDNDNWSGDETWDPNLTVSCNVEVLFPFIVDNATDFFTDQLGEGCEVEVEATFKFTAEGEDEEEFTESFTWGSSDFLTSPLVPDTGQEEDHYALGETDMPTVLNSSHTGLSSSAIENIKVKIDSVHIWRNDRVLWDYVSETEEATMESGDTRYKLYSGDDGSVGGDEPIELVFFAEVDDVLQNHNPGDWEWRTNDADSVGLSSGKYNENAGENDIVTGGAITESYIRNDYPAAKHELGRIHRAGNHQTFNLFVYNNEDDGGNAHADGDRNILDQVWLRQGSVDDTGETETIRALTEPTQIAGKINPNADWNSSSPDYGQVADALFSGLTDLSSDIRNEVVGGDPLGGRIDQIERIGPAVAPGDFEDYDREKALLKTDNQISARYSFFTAAIIGQTLKDLGDPPNTVQNESDVETYDGTNFARILAEQFILVRFARNNLVPGFRGDSGDTFTDDKTGESFEFLGTGAEGQKYYLSNSKFATWLEAARMAAEIGGKPVCFESSEEWTNVQGMLNDKAWIGLRIKGNPASPSATWPATGEWESTPEWVWCNGKSSGPRAWASGEPNEDPTPGYSNESAAVVADFGNGSWEDVSYNNGGQPLKVLIECEPKMKILDYRYYEE